MCAMPNEDGTCATSNGDTSALLQNKVHLETMGTDGLKDTSEVLDWVAISKRQPPTEADNAVGYTRLERACVTGHNIVKYTDKTVQE